MDQQNNKTTKQQNNKQTKNEKKHTHTHIQLKIFLTFLLS